MMLDGEDLYRRAGLLADFSRTLGRAFDTQAWSSLPTGGKMAAARSLPAAFHRRSRGSRRCWLSEPPSFARPILN